MVVREYGQSGHLVVVLHGGPAAVGDAALLARGLADAFTVLEPWQRGSGDEPLTVAQHVEDLHGLVAARSRGVAPAIVGHSWGAMLALCYAAAYPADVGPIVLVGSGTFDDKAKRTMQAILAERTSESLRARVAAVAATTADAAERHMKRYKLTRPLSFYEPLEPWPEKEEYEPLDVRAHNETWRDMQRLLNDRTYPQAFTAIESPVLMLHGTYDPHPGRLIHASLEPYVRRLEYREWERCGHYPWLERFTREEFFVVLKRWLAQQLVARR